MLSLLFSFMHTSHDGNSSLWGRNIVTFSFFSFFVFLGPHTRHMEVPRLGVKSELWPPTYAAATAAQDLSCVCNLCHCSQQHRIFNPQREARDQTNNLMVPDCIRFCCTTMGTPWIPSLWFKSCVLLVKSLKRILFYQLLNGSGNNNRSVEFPLLCSGLRIQHCLSCGIGRNCSLDSILGPGTSICLRCAQ